MGEFVKFNMGTGGGPGIEPPDIDGELISDDSTLLPITMPDHLQAELLRIFTN